MNYFITKLLFHTKYIKIFLVKYFFKWSKKNVSLLLIFNNFDDKIKYLIFLVINF